MSYAVFTAGDCHELVCEAESYRELIDAIEYCFDDEEHGIVRLIVTRLKRDGSPDGRFRPALVIYDHGHWGIRGTGIVAGMLRYHVNRL